MITNEDKSLFFEYQSDWNRFAKEILGVRLDRKQRKILSAIQENKRVSVRSGHARGKDYLAAVASLCFLYLNYPSKVISTAPTGRQVTSIMMAEIGKMHQNAKVMLGGEVLASKIKFEGNPDWVLEGFKASDKNTEAWTGFHSPSLMVVATEASGLAQENFDAIEGLLTGGNSKLVLIFNPNQAMGESYRSTRDKSYVKFCLSCLDAPNVRAKKSLIPGQVDYEWVVDKIDRWTTKITKDQFDSSKYDFKFNGELYRPNDLFRIKVLGQYPSESSDQLIPIAWIEAAFARHEKIESFDDDFVIGVDIAGMGRDETVFTYKHGNAIKKVDSFSRQDHMETAGRIKNIIKDGGTANIDTIGEGSGLYSRLIEMGVSNAVSAKFSYKAEDDNGNKLNDFSGELTFANMRAYCFWAIRDALNPQNGINLAIPFDEMLSQELTETKFKYRSDGSIIVEPKEDIKKRLKRSPDRADSLALTFYPTPADEEYGGFGTIRD